MNSESSCTPSPARVSAPEKWALAAARTIRILTIPPIMAALMPVLLRVMRGYFPGAALWLTILFLSVLPTLSYLVWAAVPGLRAQGRGMQRRLAVAFSVAGYVAGVVYCLAAGLGRVERIIYLTYFFSGVLIAILSACHLKSSGHACGISVSGRRTGPKPRFSPVSNRIFLKILTSAVTFTSPSAASCSSFSTSSRLRLTFRSASV